jgi:tetraacyldisaccharide 4'-kinase
MTARAAVPARPAIERLWRPRLPITHWPLWAMLTPAAAVYTGMLAVRERWWRIMARDAGVTTISVGNLTVGGNGKTPFTVFLASRLAGLGYRVGIVSRGYGRLSTGARAAMVSDGSSIRLTPDIAGDEAVMMARSFAGPVAVARRRHDGISLLARRGIDVAVLDDGFQHLRLRRDLDLLLVNAACAFGNGWVLPAGPMRERASAIRRADAVVLMALGEDAAGEQPLPNAAFEDRPVMRATLKPSGLVRMKGGQWTDCPLVGGGRRAAIVSGLASPAAFHATVRALGFQVCATLDYPDHYDYSLRDWEHIQDMARGADLLLTTEKDLVKLEKLCSDAIPLYAVRVRVVMEQSDEARLLAMMVDCARRKGAALPTPAPANSLHGGLH